MFIAGVRHISIAVLMASCLLSNRVSPDGGKIALLMAHLAQGLMLFGLLLSKVS